MHDISGMIESTLSYVWHGGCKECFFEPHGTSPLAWRTLPCLAVVYAHEKPYHFVVGANHHTAHPGEMVLVQAGEPHRVDSPHPCRLSAIHVQYSVLGGIDPLSLYAVPHELNKQRSRRLGKAFFEMIDRHSAPAETVAEVAGRRACALRFLSELLADADPCPSAMATLKELPRLQDVLSYVDTHLAEPIRRDDLAQMAGLSPSRFSVVFHSIMGTSPMQFVQRQRLHHAMTLLRNPETTLAKVADDLGYCDAFQFSRQFKKSFGISPSHYRKALAHKVSAWMPYPS